MPEREKSDLLHAGNLLISMFVERSETKIEPLCQFCVSWHTPSRSVLLEMAGMAETDDRAKTRVVSDFQGFCERMDGAARQD